MRFVLYSSLSFLAIAQQGVNPVPSGAMHVVGNAIVDSGGRKIVLRGAGIPGLNLIAPDAADLATFSATTFSTMRQRWNMNVLRLPVASWIAANDPQYLPRVTEIVRKANVAGLVVILAACEDLQSGAPFDIGLPTAQVVDFWKIWAAYFKNNPMIVFDVYNSPDAANIPGHQAGIHSPSDWQFWLHGGVAVNGQPTVGMQALVDAIRSVSATQVIAVMGLDDSPEMRGLDASAYVHDPNILYEVHPYYSRDLTAADRDAHFGFLSSKFPLLAGEWGLNPAEDSANCRAAPNDPQQAQQLIEDTLAYFETHNISWTISTFLPGNLYIDFSDYYRTDLFESWTCGAPVPPGLGIGEPVNYYLDGLKEGDLVPVNSGSGNVVAIARGAVIAMYGDRMSDSTETSYSTPPPASLGGISVQITDASGAVRLAGLLYVSPYLVNLVLPPETALGVATFLILGGSGAGLQGHVLVQNVVPGLFTANLNGRGPVIGSAVETTIDGPPSTSLLWRCTDSGCTTVPIAISPDATVTVSVLATGIRNVSSLDHVTVMIGGIQVPVLYAGVQNESQGIDEIDLQLLPELRGMGETDLIVIVDGEVSNAVRINIQ